MGICSSTSVRQPAVITNAKPDTRTPCEKLRDRLYRMYYKHMPDLRLPGNKERAMRLIMKVKFPNYVF